MDHEVLTLQEVSLLLGKSTQTLRRMIKKGELSAKRIHTPQGFQYAIYKHSLHIRGNPSAANTSSSPTLDNPLDKLGELQEELPPRVNGPLLIKQHQKESFLDNEYFALESTPPPPPPPPPADVDLRKMLELTHREKMALIHILERLQVEWMSTQSKPPSFFQRLFGWWKR